MKKQHGCLAVLLCSLLLLCAFVWLFDREGAGMWREQRWEEEADGIYAAIPLSGFGKQTIRLWHQEEETKYYLFLPSFWQEEKRIRLWSGKGEPLSLDGKLLPSSGRVGGLGEGVHTLTVAGKEYSLEVIASDQLPALFVDMDNEKRRALEQEPYEEQTQAGVYLITTEGRVETEGTAAGIRVRGNTSADWVKKPYQVRMQQATDFLGMGAAVKWNLLSNWSDKTLLRNKLTYDMARDAGMAYAPESGFVDLYVNGSYQGCYQLCEKVEIGKNRVNIRNLEEYTLYEPSEEEQQLEYLAEVARQDPAAAGIVTAPDGTSSRGYGTRLGTEDLSGGYLLEIERPSRIYASASFFVTKMGQPVTIKRPKYADASQVSYIAGRWQAFEDALYAEDGINPATGLHYTDYINQESFVKKYLVEEIVRNYDASSTSQYFYKDTDAVDGRIYAGPVWDYDMSLGNPIMSPLTNQHYISSVSPYGLFAALPMDEFSIWYRLYEKEEFRRAAAAIYAQDFLPLLRALEEEKIERQAEGLQASALMDGVRWGRNKGTDQESRLLAYWASVAELKQFVKKRESYLTGLWVDGRESKKVYLDGGDGDLYISYVEGLVGDVLEEPLAPSKEGYRFVQWLNGYTNEPYDFTKPYEGGELYFKAEYENEADGSRLIAGE